MAAHRAPLSHDLLARVSNPIINEVRGINRVVRLASAADAATAGAVRRGRKAAA
jgi:GMP synthase PP-ATPase subunit